MSFAQKLALVALVSELIGLVLVAIDVLATRAQAKKHQTRGQVVEPPTLRMHAQVGGTNPEQRLVELEQRIDDLREDLDHATGAIGRRFSRELGSIDKLVVGAFIESSPLRLIGVTLFVFGAIISTFSNLVT